MVDHCLYEKDWGETKSAIRHLETQFDKFMTAQAAESRAAAIALTSITTMYEQAAQVLAMIQNTIHGPNRDNGIVQTALSTKHRVDDLESDAESTEKSIADLRDSIQALKDTVQNLRERIIRITATISVLGALGMQILAWVLRRFIGG